MSARPAPKTITYYLPDASSDVESMVSDLRDELQSWYDALPENLQSGSKADALQEAIGYLEGVCDATVEVPDCLSMEFDGDRPSFEHRPMSKSRPARRERCSEAADILRSCAATAREWAQERRDWIAQAEQRLKAMTDENERNLKATIAENEERLMAATGDGEGRLAAIINENEERLKAVSNEDERNTLRDQIGLFESAADAAELYADEVEDQADTLDSIEFPSARG